MQPNYPPGVTGNEPEIAGQDTDDMCDWCLDDCEVSIIEVSGDWVCYDCLEGRLLSHGIRLKDIKQLGKEELANDIRKSLKGELK